MSLPNEPYGDEEMRILAGSVDNDDSSFGVAIPSAALEDAANVVEGLVLGSFFSNPPFAAEDERNSFARPYVVRKPNAARRLVAPGGGEDDTTDYDPAKNATARVGGTASTFVGILTMIASNIGAGALSLPYAFKVLGVVPALFMLAVSGLMCAYTVYILIRVGVFRRRRTYEGLAFDLFGNVGKFAVALTLLLMLWGCCAVYIKIIGQFLGPFLELLADRSSFPHGVWGERLGATTVWALLMLPFCLMKSIDSLAFASSFSSVAIFVVLAALIIHAAQNVSSSEARDHFVVWGAPNLSVLEGLNNIKTSLSSQTSAFVIYSGLRDSRVTNMNKVNGAATLFCCAVYAAVGLTGLLAVGPGVTSNVLTGIPDPTGKWYAIMAYAAMATVITVCFPVTVFPARDAVLAMLGYRSTYETPDRVRVLVSLALAVTALLFGLFAPSLDLLFGIIGGVAGNLISNVFPCLFALRCGDWTVMRVGWVHCIAVWVPLVYGITVGPLGTAVSIYLTIRG